jgi:hypothetical protein
VGGAENPAHGTCDFIGASRFGAERRILVAPGRFVMRGSASFWEKLFGALEVDGFTLPLAAGQADRPGWHG